MLYREAHSVIELHSFISLDAVCCNVRSNGATKFHFTGCSIPNIYGVDKAPFHWVLHMAIRVFLWFSTTKYLSLDVYAEIYRVKLRQNFRSPYPVY
jgi:hypothetical protein